MGVNLFMQIFDMKKFVCKLILFAACMFFVDYAIGRTFDLLRESAIGGDTQNDYVLSEKCKADILVLGSSRARHHYNPTILDSIGGFSYNGGKDGIGIVSGLGRYMLCAERHRPKIVIYEITPEFDYLIYGESNSKYLNPLKPYFERNDIKSIFEKVETPFNLLKMHSSMYQNNSMLIANLTDLVVKRPNIRGFYPESGVLENSNKKSEDVHIVIDSVKYSLLEQLIKETGKNKTKLYFAISPRFFKNKTEKFSAVYMPGLELAEKHKVPVLNYLFTPNISDNPKMFVDFVHMNNLGADAYSRIVVDQIRKDIGLSWIDVNEIH